MFPNPGRIRQQFIAGLFISGILLTTHLGLGQTPAQNPGRGPTSGPAQRVAALMDRLHQALASLDLNDDQKTNIESIISQVRQEFRDSIPELLQLDPQGRRQRFLDLMNGLRVKISPLLTDEQAKAFQQKTAEILRQMFGTGPTTQALGRSGGAGPTSGPAGAGMPPAIGTAIERLRSYVSQLGLTEDQKSPVEKLFADTRQQLIDLRQQAQGEMTAVAPKVQEVVQQLRDELGALLTPEQLQKLRDLASQGGGRRGGRGARRGGGAGPDTGAMMPPEMQPESARGAPSAAVHGTISEQELPLIDPGKTAPNFSLRKLDGQSIQLSAFKGRPVLLVFGSYSSPSFRQRAAALEQIRRDFGSLVGVIVIYTREDHPVGPANVERNKQDGIAVEQPTDMNGRTKLAEEARRTLNLTVPIALDTMDDITAKNYGASLSNAAYLIGRDGTVVVSQRWFEPYSMRRQIQELLRKSNIGE